jgi:hypothetical protein
MRRVLPPSTSGKLRPHVVSSRRTFTGYERACSVAGGTTSSRVGAGRLAGGSKARVVTPVVGQTETFGEDGCAQSRRTSPGARPSYCSLIRHRKIKSSKRPLWRRCPVWVCAVEKRRFPVGARPTRQPLERDIPTTYILRVAVHGSKTPDTQPCRTAPDRSSLRGGKRSIPNRALIN